MSDGITTKFCQVCGAGTSLGTTCFCCGSIIDGTRKKPLRVAYRGNDKGADRFDGSPGEDTAIRAMEDRDEN